MVSCRGTRHLDPERCEVVHLDTVWGPLFLLKNGTILYVLLCKPQPLKKLIDIFRTFLVCKKIGLGYIAHQCGPFVTNDEPILIHHY